jgi:hypothetical protein
MKRERIYLICYTGKFAQIFYSISGKFVLSSLMLVITEYINEQRTNYLICYTGNFAHILYSISGNSFSLH